jgi:hypothetical protein
VLYRLGCRDGKMKKEDISTQEHSSVEGHEEGTSLCPEKSSRL